MAFVRAGVVFLCSPPPVTNMSPCLCLCKGPLQGLQLPDVGPRATQHLPCNPQQ